MLDDATFITKYDPTGYLGFAARQPEQLAYDFGVYSQRLERPVKQIVFAGMGGSSLVAELVHTWPALGVPFVVAKEYHVPAFVNEDTLVICASYSGNTEETLSSLAEAEAKGAQIAIIAGGGKLGEKAREKGYLYTQIPECPQPRVGVLYMYRAVCELFVAAEVLSNEVLSELSSVIPALEEAIAGWQPELSTDNNEAKRLAQKMHETTPIIYGGPLMAPAAYKWKIDLNENAKNTGWSNAFPEMNHNEFIGWSSHPSEKPFSVIDLISSLEHPQVLKRFEVTDRLLKGMKPASSRVEAKGKTELEHILYLVLLGDFATIYLALLNNVDPAPVPLVEQLKKEL